MVTYTSTLTDELFNLLTEKAKELKVPKNKLIEQALSIYLDQLNRAAYVRSYKEAGADHDLMQVAEEGMGEYMAQIADETR